MEDVEEQIKTAKKRFLEADDLANYWHEKKKYLSEKLLKRQVRVELVNAAKREFGNVKAFDFVDNVSEVISKEDQLPAMIQLKRYITRPLPESQRFPILRSTYQSLVFNGAVTPDVFRRATPEDGYLQSQHFAFQIQSPPVPDSSTDSYHALWDVLVYTPIRTFLGDYSVRNVRSERGESSSTRCDSTYYVDSYALFMAQEKGLKTRGDHPAQELVVKDIWPYLDSVPYVLGYWARGYRLVLCPFYRHNGSQHFDTTQCFEIMEFDLGHEADRIGLFLACFHIAKILKVLRDICVRKGLEPDTVDEGQNGKVGELPGDWTY